MAEVAESNRPGVFAAAGAHGRDEGNAALQAAADQVGFGIDAVDGVNEKIVCPGQQPVGGVVMVEFPQRPDVDIGIDVPQPPGGHVDLGPADGAGKGEELPVDVGGSDQVEVHQGQGADAAAGQGLGGKGADGAEADDGHVAFLEDFQVVAAD